MSEIAFKPEDAKLPRYVRRRMKKKKDYMWLCPNCGNVEFGGHTAHFHTFVDEKGKEYKRRIHRTCSRCGAHMIKVNVKKEVKK